MSDIETKRISELIAAQDISDSDLFVIEQGGAAKKALGSVVKGAIGGSSLPSGGTPGQVLTKTSAGAEWDDVSGLPDGGNNGQVLTKTSSGAEWSDAGTPTQAQTDSAVADWLDAHPEATTTVQDGAINYAKLDSTLKAKADDVDGLKSSIGQMKGFDSTTKAALLALFQKCAFADDDAQTYYDALEDALYPPADLVSISAVFNQESAVIYDTDSLDTLKPYLTVTANMDDGTTQTVSNYTLSGTLTEGTSTITVSYGGKTATFDVEVEKWWDIKWDYTDGLPENNGFTKTYTNGTATMTANGLECSGTNLAYTPNNEQSCTKVVFECVFIPEVLLSQSNPSGNGIKFAVFNGTRATTIGINSKGICGYKASISGYEIAYSNISVNTEYKIRIETEGDTGTVYLNDEFIYTVALATTTTTNSRVFASAGGSGSQKTLYKAFRYRFVQ